MVQGVDPNIASARLPILPSELCSNQLWARRGSIGATISESCATPAVWTAAIELSTAPLAPNDAIACTSSGVESDDAEGRLASIAGEAIVDPASESGAAGNVGTGGPRSTPCSWLLAIHHS
jgi:hypothetical protein